MKILRNNQDAEGMVREVFIAVWENREKLDENKSFSGFVFSITKSKALNRIKQNLSEKVYLEYMEMEHQVQIDKENDIVSRELMDYHQDINKSLKSSLSLALVNNEEFFIYPLLPCNKKSERIQRLIYLFEVNGNNGYIILSGDDRITPDVINNSTWILSLIQFGQ